MVEPERLSKLRHDVASKAAALGSAAKLVGKGDASETGEMLALMAKSLRELGQAFESLRRELGG